MEVVECRVCGAEVGRGPAGLGIKQHSGRHRREFVELVGREPESYEEVIEFFNTEGRQPTLLESMSDAPQSAIVEFSDSNEVADYRLDLHGSSYGGTRR